MINFESAEHSPSAPPPAKRPTVDVLVIDDEEAIRIVMADCLTQLGYTHRCATDGMAAIALMQTYCFRLVVTDIFMPRMDGIELIMHCRTAAPEALIVACSGGGGHNQDNYALESAKLMGSKRVLVKPFTVPEFATLVREMIGPGLAD